MMHNQKGYPTGFKDCYGKNIHVGDKVVEGCNLLVSTVCWDNDKGTYKMSDLGDYYIKDSAVEWMIIESFEEVKEDLKHMPYRLFLEEFRAFESKLNLLEKEIERER